MTQPSPQRRLWLRLLLWFCVFSLVIFALLGWYVTTDSFHQAVRRHVIASLEQATGGRVELGELHTTPFRLRIDVRNLTIHGREAANETPYLHIDRLQAELKIISFLSTTIGLHSLILDRPVMHIVVYPDGSTSQPSPPHSQSSVKPFIEQLFAISVSHAEVHRGELQWEQRRIPLELDARDVSLALSYSFLRQQYAVQVSAGNVPSRIQQRPPFTWKGDASLVLMRDRADIGALNLASGKSEFHFTGQIVDFQNPQVRGDYRGMLEMGELTKLLPGVDFRKGSAQIQGRGSWSLSDFSLDGTLQAKDLDWASHNVNLQNGRLSAAYAITPQRLRVSAIRASLMGGELRGEVDVSNWQKQPPSPPSAPAQRRTLGRVSTESLQRGAVRLQMTSFPITPAFAFLSSRDLPLDHLNFTGAVSGDVNMLWIGSIEDAETKFALNIAPPSQPVPGQVALRGQMDGIYRGSGEELELNQLHLTTPASDITASGKLAASTSLKLTFDSHDLREWKPLLQAAFNSQQLPFAVHGFATFNGTATGKASALSLNGNLEVYDFDTTLPATDRLPERVVHWDALTGNIQYSANNFSIHNGALVHGPTVAHVDLTTALSHGILQENSLFALHLDLINLNLSEVGQLAGYQHPIGGTLDFSGRLAGTRANPHGEGHMQVRDASAFGVPISAGGSDVRLSNHELQFDRINANVYGATMTGSAAVSTWLDNFRMDLSGENVDLAELPHFHNPRITIDGHAGFHVVASGTPQQPTVEAHARFRGLAFNNEPAGDFYLDANTHGREAEIQGHSEFEKADLKIHGVVGLDQPYPADLSVNFDHLDVDSVLNAYLQGKATGHAPFSGTVRLRGPLRSPEDLKVEGQIHALNAEIEHVKLQNAEPIRFEVADQTLRLEEFHLTGSGTNFAAHGTAHLTQPRGMDFHLEGTVNVGLLRTLNPKVSAEGTLNVKLDANGTVADPVLQGRIEVKDASLSHDDFPSGLSALNGELVFDRNRIQIERLTGATGGGIVALTGSATYQKGTLSLDLGASARDVRLRYPPGVSSTANADLRLTGTSNAAQLSGNVMVTKLSVTPGFDFGSYLEKSKQAVVVTPRDSLANRLKLDVHVTTTPELRMQTAIAKLSGNADLRLRGTADRPVLTGRTEVLEGEISFNGTKYRIDRGDITFANPAKTEPILDIQASTRVRDYDITVTLNGDASKPNALRATWRSEPPLPEADVIALLALGRTREESAAATQTSGSFGFGGEASNLLINEALNSAVSSRVQRLFGVSRIKIDPQGLASETNIVRGPQVTIEQQVASNVTVTYSTNVSVASQQIIQVEYNVTRNVSIVALRDQNGVVSFDIKIRQRKR